MTFKRNITSLFALMLTLSAYSQSLIFGKVQDAFLKTPLPEAKVSVLLAADSTVVIDSIPVRKKHGSDGTVKAAEFIFKPERKTCKYLLHATLAGYEDAYHLLAIDENDQDAIMLDHPLGLRRIRERQLGEAMVKATRIKMFYKGDTLVYDATAFKLPDGSMLDELIRQMPGVTMNNNGVISVNGRRVDELQLGSRSFMRGNSKVLLENLPYYTVKHIKVYEQDTDLNRAMGAQLEKKRFVMDVNLKPEYQRGYIANVEAAGGTEERWLGRAFLLSFTNKTRYALSANSNNVNESRHIGGSNHWTPQSMPNSLLTTHSVKGEIDYQSSDKNVQENLNVDFTSSRNEKEMSRRNELFVTGNPLNLSHQNSLGKENVLKLGNKFKYISPERLMFDTDLAVDYKSYSGNSFMLSEQYVDSLTLCQRNAGLNDGSTWKTKFYAHYYPKLKDLEKWQQFFWVKTFCDYQSDENQQAQRFHINNLVSPSDSQSHNANDYSNKKYFVRPLFRYSIDSKDTTYYAYIEAAPSFSRNQTKDWLYHPDTLLLPSELDMLQAITDPANSYHSDLRTYKGDYTFYITRYQQLPGSLFGKWPRELVDLKLKLSPLRERLHYRRGYLDTLATRNTLLIDAAMSMHFYIRKNVQSPVHIAAGYRETETPLLNQIGYRDDATPLVVRLGNPNLKPYNSMCYIEMRHTDERSRRHHHLIDAGFYYNPNQVSQSVSFNPTSGVYTYRPDNVSGSYYFSTGAKVLQRFGKNLCWTVDNLFNCNFRHSLDHTLLVGETESHVSAVNTFTVHDGGYIQYEKDGFNVRATADIRWRHSEGKMRDFETLNATDFNYGLSGRYTLPRLKTTFSAEGKMFSRRGYGSTGLNTDDFVLNASISQPFLKGKLVARLEAFDILHQLSSTQYEVNAQGRIETWYRSLPHYFMAHLIYHFNKNPKKGK